MFDVASAASAWRSHRTDRVGRSTAAGIEDKAAISQHVAPRVYRGLRSLGMALLGSDPELQGAIRRRMAGGTRGDPGGVRGNRPAPTSVDLAKLSDQRRALLQLHYSGKISADGFKEEEDRLFVNIELARTHATLMASEAKSQSELEQRFQRVAEVLSSLDIGAVWNAAQDSERRVLVEEFLEWVTVFPDHLEVLVIGAPALNVLLGEVGLKESEIVGVGGATQRVCNQALDQVEVGRLVRSDCQLSKRRTTDSKAHCFLGVVVHGFCGECEGLTKLALG